MTGLTFGNGMSLSQTFDLRYQPAAIQSGPLSLTMQPTPGGDVGVVRDRSEDLGCVRGVDRSLRYDFLDRLVGWSDAAQSGVGICPAEGLGRSRAAYGYVEGTDLLSYAIIPDGLGSLAYAFGYDQQHNVSAIWGYDATGTSVTAAVCLRHDALGRLVLVGPTHTAPTPGGTACASDAEVTGALARFQYDVSNRRVARQVDGRWTYVVSDSSGNPLAELAMTGDPASPWAKVRDYVWLDHRLLAQVEYGATASTYYAHVDHLGTPRALTSESGQLVWSAFQRPYGEVGEKTVPDAVTGQTVVTNLRLPGQYDERLLGSLGLQGPYYNWNRWYLPSVGRYLELDPIAKAGGFNGEYGPDWYSYAEANPLRYTDPWGLETQICRAPLHALPGTKGARNGPDVPGNPFYRRYLCVNKTECGGQDRSKRSPWWELGSPGTPSVGDKYKKDNCEKAAPDNKCLEDCILKRIRSPDRPYYSIGPLGTDCQEWAPDTLESCQVECKGK